MAKPKRKLYDFTSNQSDWARKERERFLNATERVNQAILAGLEAGELESVSEEQRQQLVNQVLRTGEFDLQEPVAVEEAPVLPSAEPVKERGFFDSVIDFGSNILATRKAANAREELDRLTAQEYGARLFDKEEPSAASIARGLAIPTAAIQETKQQLEEKQAAYARRKLEAKADFDVAQKELISLESNLGGRTSAGSRVSRVLGGLAAQPEQALPILGGIGGGALGTFVEPGAGTTIGAVLGSSAGASTMIEPAFNSAFAEAIEEFGATKEEAEDYAAVMTGIEFGTEALGGLGGAMFTKGIAKFGLKKATREALREKLATRVASRLGRFTGAAASGAAEEVAAEAAGDIVRAEIKDTDFFSSEESKEALRKRSIEDAVTRFDRYLDAGIAGAIGEGGIGSIIGAHQYGAEISKQVKDTQEAADRELAAEQARVESTTNEKLKEEFEKRRIQEEKDKAFQQQQAQELIDAQRKADEEEAGFRTMELEREFAGQTQLEEYAGVQERRQVNPPVEVTPEQVAAEREQERAAEERRIQQEEQAFQLDEIQKRQQEVRRAAEKQSKEQKKATEKAEKERRQKVLDDLIKENPDADPAQLLPLYQQRLAATVETTPTPKPVTKKEVTPKVVPTKTTPAKAAPKGQVTSDSDIEQMKKGLGLQMETQDQTALPEAEGQAKRQKVIEQLVRKNKNKTVDVQNLIRQGKMVVARNPEEIGRSDTGAGTFDRETGKMYVYTDRMNADNPVSTMLQAALHEPVHAGQFNEREARSTVMQTLMSPESNSKVNQTIRAAAKNGNKIAQQVVEDATAAAQANQDFDGDVESLELAPYLATRVEEARGKPLGQLGGAVRDVIANTKNFLRERTGLDLDVTIDDLATATQQAAGEMVRTEITPEGEGSLQIEAGPNATGFKRAQTRGETYEGADTLSERFEINDADAEVLETESLLSASSEEPAVLSEVLNHDSLYEQYPSLKNYKVITEELGTGIDGYNDSAKQTLALSRNLIRAANYAIDPEAKQIAQDRVRNVILHETQHAIQDVEGWPSGANAESFIPASVVSKRQRARAYLSSVIKNFDLGKAVTGLPPAVRRAWDNEIKALGSESRDEQAALFLDEGYFADTSDRMSKRYGENTYTEAVRQYTEANLEYRQAESNAFRLYLRDLGEAGARNVEQRSRMTAAERAATPFNETLATDELSKARDVKREDLLDTLPYQLGNRKLPLSALQMATPKARTSRKKTQAERILTNLFDAAGGVGKHFNELIEFAASSPAEARMIAERNMHIYSSTLGPQAKKLGLTPKQLNAQIQKELDEATKATTGYDENYAAFADIAKKYGRAGQALLDMRNQIDALTRDMIQARLAKGTPLTMSEKKLYETLINNLGRYTHRQYASMVGKVGDKYSQQVWKDYEKVKEGKGRNNPETLANYNRVDRAVKYLIDHNLNIPEDEALLEISSDQLDMLYDIWPRSDDPSQPTPDEKVESLSRTRDDITPERLNAVAEGLTQELLGLTDKDDKKAISRYYRGEKQDMGILKERQFVPVEIRDLLGEIKDPSMRMMLTVAKQAEFVARNKLLLNVSQDIGPQVQPPEAIGTPAAKNLIQLSGEGWGPLNGYFVSKELKTRLGDTLLQIANLEQAAAMAGVDQSVLAKTATNMVVNAWGKVAGLSKMLQIVGKPANFVYNYLGAYAMLVTNGNIDPRTWVRAHQAMSEIVANAINPKTAGRLAVEANKYGITDSAFIGELRSGQHKELQSLIKEMAGLSPGRSLYLAHKAGTFSKELYAMMDVWSKIGNFYHETDVLTAYYKAAGINKSTEEIKREAADRTNRTNITYKRAAPVFRAAERMGATAFGVYFYEVFRSQIGNMMQGLSDISNSRKAPNAKSKAIMASHGLSRVSGQLLVWYAMAAMAKAGAKDAFGDDEDDQDKRYLLPDFMRNQDFIRVGKDKDGNEVLFDIARFDPVGPITDIMRAIQNEDDDDLQAAVDRIKELYVAPRIGPQLLTALGATFTDNVKSTRDPSLHQAAPGVYKELTDLGDDRKIKAWVNVLEAFLPGIVAGYRKDNPTPEIKDEASLAAATMEYLGASLYKLSPEQSARNAAFDYSDATKAARSNFNDIMKDVGDQLSQADLAERLAQVQEPEQRAFTEMHNVIKGLRAIDMSEREITVLLKDVGLSAKEIAAVKSGEFRSGAISEKSMKTKMKNEMLGKTESEKAKIKDKWDSIKLMIKAGEE